MERLDLQSRAEWCLRRRYEGKGSDTMTRLEALSTSGPSNAGAGRAGAGVGDA
jgi:hypothetical protein